MGQEPLVDTGFLALDNIINPAIHSSLSADQAGGISTLQTVVSVLAVVWLAGIAVFFVYTAISFLRIRKNISTAVLVRDNIFQSENVRSPFVFGLVRPRIYLPLHLNEADMSSWIGVAAIVAIVVMALCFLTSPKFKREETAIVEDYADDYVVMQDYYELDDGRWACGDYTYTYRLVLTGSIKSNAASTSITYIVLSNTQDITFEQAHKASGMSSNIDDYFDPETAVIVAHIYDDK